MDKYRLEWARHNEPIRFLNFINRCNSNDKHCNVTNANAKRGNIKCYLSVKNGDLSATTIDSSDGHTSARKQNNNTQINWNELKTLSNQQRQIKCGLTGDSIASNSTRTMCSNEMKLGCRIIGMVAVFVGRNWMKWNETESISLSFHVSQSIERLNYVSWFLAWDALSFSHPTFTINWR